MKLFKRVLSLQKPVHCMPYTCGIPNFDGAEMGCGNTAQFKEILAVRMVSFSIIVSINRAIH